MASGGDKSIMKQLDDITECSICSETFTDPRSLSCFHSFCLKCFEGYARDEQPGAKMPCPMCRKEFTIPDGGVSELPKNFFVGKLLQIKSSASGSTPSLCDSCQPDETLGVVKNNAAVYCVECHEKYCEDCAKSHKTFKMSKSHQHVKLDESGELCHHEEVISKSSPSLCVKHPDQGLSVYCHDCKSAICVVCYIASHKQHDCSDINDVTEKFRDLVTTDVQSLADVAGKLREMLSSTEQQKKNFTKSVGEAEMEVCKEAERMKQLIECNKQTLLDELKTNQQQVVKKFDNLSDEIKHHLTLVDNLKKYADELSRKGAAVDIARETSVLHDRVKELLNLDAVELSRDAMDTTGVRFTASNVLTSVGGNDNAIGKIAVKSTTPTLIHVVMPAGRDAVGGVTSLLNQLFVVRFSSQQQIEVYDTETFKLQRNISVPGLSFSLGLASCAVSNCLYVTESDARKGRVYRVALSLSSDTVTEWRVGRNPWGVSVNSANNVLVTCYGDDKIQEYTTHGSLIREISTSSAGISEPVYSIQLPSGHIAISYGDRVCAVDNNGALIHKHTNTTGASIQFIGPRGFTPVQNGCTLLANYCANQILVFNRSFTSARVLSLPSDCPLEGPYALFFDRSRGRLYVGEYKGKRVLVFDNMFNVGIDFR